jgi:hypothetical protein
MEELLKISIGIFFLILGFYIGDFLAKITKEELKSGQIWFKLIIFLSLFFSVVFLILKQDILFFSFLFIAIVTARSLRIKN